MKPSRLHLGCFGVDLERLWEDFRTIFASFWYMGRKFILILKHLVKQKCFLIFFHVLLSLDGMVDASLQILSDVGSKLVEWSSVSFG